MARLLFLGLDGATWDVLDPLMAAGHLPTFQRLADEGTRGKLASTHPPVTFPAWRVLSSGKHPGKLGVYGWNHPDFQRRKFVYPSATDYRTRDVWDYLNAAGLTTAVVNQPGTYPPPDVDGVLIAGPESQGPDLVRPRSRADLLERYEQHSHGIGTYLQKGDLPRALKVIDNGFDVAASLAPEVDVVHHVVFLTDTVQHHLWDDEAAMRTTWQHVDQGLARLLDAADPDTVVMASDHGFQRLDHLVNLNTALAEAGLATVELPSGTSLAARVGLDRARVLRAAAKLGIHESTLARLPAFLKDRVPEATGGLGTRREGAVDWDATVALTGDGRGVHVRDPSRVDDVKGVLLGLAGPNDERLIDAVLAAEDAWDGPYLDRAPDLLVVPVNGVEPGGGLGAPLVREPVPGRTWLAHHHPDGMFLAWGDGFRAGAVEGTSIVDITPTILAACGAPVPTDVDGTIADVFGTRPDVGTCDPLEPVAGGPAYSRDEEALVEKRLEDLGYL